MNGFHLVIQKWFSTLGTPSDAQVRGWKSIQNQQHTLIAAPTGSGKTLAAFLVCLDDLFKQAISGQLEEQLQVLYISPLKALSNDIQKNLDIPLTEITRLAETSGLMVPTIRALVRTGDTPQHRRQAMLKKPPHILVTTPESLYLMLTSPKARHLLTSVKTVIIDEIHALARDKRGSHLALSLERLEQVTSTPPQRIGLSATQRPIDDIARFLVGDRNRHGTSTPNCVVVDSGHVRKMDLEIEIPKIPLSAVCSNEQWAELYQRIADLVLSHRSTLIFVNTRRMAERVSYMLRDLLGKDGVASHHGSLSKKIRLDVENRLKAGELKAIVATASLELGIDIGYLDLVCQIGSPRSIATFLQRVGRSGHSLGGVPRGKLFALTRDELLESYALIRAIREKRLDAIEIPTAPIDILAQQIVAEVAAQEWDEDELFHAFKKAAPYRDMSRELFNNTIELISEGITTRTRVGAYIYRDQINGKLRARPSARISATTSGGAIPEQADYRVITEEEGTYVGTVNEDFAIESSRGDIFILGNTSWQIQAVRGGEVLVKDAQGAPATIPFWLGEAPGRTVELSQEISILREAVAHRLNSEHLPNAISESLELVPDQIETPPSVYTRAIGWLQRECGAGKWDALQAVHYIAAQKIALGLIPTQKKIVFERFFDESGGMQLVIHSPYGTRINRAWGLALRKSFCRSFDFELQASADDNGIVLSLGPNQSFPLESMFKLLHPDRARATLEQALLAVPMFQVRWRWNTMRALFVLRFRSGKKVPPALLRFRSDDLLTAVFPAQTACQENVTGDLPIPDHPLVAQTIHDCFTEAMDFDRWVALLEAIENKEVELIARDSREPSPFSYEILNANPYAFLDDAPLEERRARAVSTRRGLDLGTFNDLSQLDEQVIQTVSSQAWPLVRDPDELHDTLRLMGLLEKGEAAQWATHFEGLESEGRAFSFPVGIKYYWAATESAELIKAVYGKTAIPKGLIVPTAFTTEVSKSDGRIYLVRGRLSHSGPTTTSRISDQLSIESRFVESALGALEGEGFALRGKFTSQGIEEWCERGLLARIHRGTLDGLRAQIRPVAVQDFLHFLADHLHLTEERKTFGRQGLLNIFAKLQGFEMPAESWESEALASRVSDYSPELLDEVTRSGYVSWGKFRAHKKEEASSTGLNRSVPLAWFDHEERPWLLPTGNSPPSPRSSDAKLTLEALQTRGACFFRELLKTTNLLPSQLKSAISELISLGWLSCDGYAALRPFLSAQKKPKKSQGVSQRDPFLSAGRWYLLSQANDEEVGQEDYLKAWAKLLLKRYGVVFRDLLTREGLAPRWGALVYVYRQMEARGEIRGGRFVSSVGGEQFASPEVIKKLRQQRKSKPKKEGIVISAADPTNLFGVITLDNRIPAKRTNLIYMENGLLIASRQGDEIHYHRNVPSENRSQIERRLRLSAIHRKKDPFVLEKVRRPASAKPYLGLRPVQSSLQI